jgi:hypothetical protein
MEGGRLKDLKPDDGDKLPLFFFPSFPIQSSHSSKIIFSSRYSTLLIAR